MATLNDIRIGILIFSSVMLAWIIGIFVKFPLAEYGANVIALVAIFLGLLDEVAKPTSVICAELGWTAVGLVITIIVSLWIGEFQTELEQRSKHRSQ